MSIVSRKGRTARIAAALGISAATLWAAGCGGSSEANVEAGKTLFEQSCASCHMLADAPNPNATDPYATPIGPDLDDAFRASREVGMDDAQFEGVVLRWLKIAQPPMPRLDEFGWDDPEQDARDVAAYVASVAGTGPAADESHVFRPGETPAAPDPPRQEIN